MPGRKPTFPSFVRSTLIDCDPLTGRPWNPRDPFICFAENESGGGNEGGGAPPPKTFTQEDLDRVVQKRVGEVQKKFADYDSLKEAALKVPELMKTVEELKEQTELAGKGEKEREKLLAEKLYAKTEKEKQEISTQLAAAQASEKAAKESLRQTLLRHQITTALTGAKALPGAIEDATHFLMTSATDVEIDDSGRLVSLTFDGIPYKDAAKAAEAFLKAKPHYAAAPAGGGGTRGSNGGPLGKNYDSMSPAELAEIGLNEINRR